MKVSLITIQYGSTDLLENLFNSLVDHSDCHVLSEIVVVNNGEVMSDPIKEKLDAILESIDIHIVKNEKESYASGVNRGVNIANGDILLIANNDVKWSQEESIKPLINKLQTAGAGIVGPQLIYPDGSWQRSFGNIPSVYNALKSTLFIDTVEKIYQSWKFKNGYSNAKEVDYIDGAFMVVRRACFNQLNGFDERFDFYAEDSDFCIRARTEGWHVVFEPHSQIIHQRGATSTQKELSKYTRLLLDAKSKLVEKHGGQLQKRLFLVLTKIALWERAKIFSLISKIKRSSLWEKRASDARTRLQAATDRNY